MLVRVVLAAAVLAAVPTRTADACTCDVRLQWLPADGAADVPLDSVVLLEAKYGPISIELRSATETVALAQEAAYDGATFWTLARPARLDANTQYTLTFSDSSGHRTVTSTFTTGSAVHAAPTSFAGLSAARFEMMAYPFAGGCIDSCVAGSGQISRIRLEFPPLPADRTFAVFEVSRDGVVASRPRGSSQPAPSSMSSDSRYAAPGLRASMPRRPTARA